MQFKHKRDLYYAALCGSHVTLPMTDAPANGCVNEKLVYSRVTLGGGLRF